MEQKRRRATAESLNVPDDSGGGDELAGVAVGPECPYALTRVVETR
jgi:hypothetical protein